MLHINLREGDKNPGQLIIRKIIKVSPPDITF